MVTPPSGTVTFLFTDIEGSTRLAREFPETLPAALAQHQALMQRAIETNHGFVFQIVGDAFCAAFHHAGNGLNAALAAQRELQNMTDDGGRRKDEIGPGQSENSSVIRHPSSLNLRVRMGIHTGDVELRDGSYHGYLTLAHTQRIMSAASGGQVLVSSQTEALLRDGLPGGVMLRDLGAVQLKDFPRVEHLFQLVAPDLPADFPALTTLATTPNNLPVQLTSFVGREKEMAEIKRLLGTTRLLTLTGSGGTGKTRLSLQVAARALNDYPGGIWFVELAAVTDAALIPQTVAAVLGLREDTGQTLPAKLAAFLSDKQLLLMLDNCEHLIEACARLSDLLLRAAPTLKIIATSREALGITGETTYHVPSLEIPNPKDHVPFAELSQNASVQLFVERAAAAKPGFFLSEDNAPSITQMCSRLDGIPLAIELAAARVRALPVEQIAARLDDRFRLLSGGSRTALPRQQTLRALIDWSYALLTEPERALLRRLSVFAGGWTLEAAEFVCSSEYPIISSQTGENIQQPAEHAKDNKLASDDWQMDSDILERLTRLVEKSLVVLDDQAGEPRRIRRLRSGILPEFGDFPKYRMLETIRQYARDKLLESGEGTPVRDAHAAYFTRWAEAMEPRLQGGPDQLEWFDRWEADFDNVRAALEWTLNRPLGELALRLVAAAYRFWNQRGYWAEGRAWLERVLAAVDHSVPSVPLARALWQASQMDGLMGDALPAAARAEESLAILKQKGDVREVPNALSALYGAMAKRRDLPARWLAGFDEAIALARTLNDQDAEAVISLGASFYAMSAGEYDRARQYVERGLAAAQILQEQTITPALRRALGYILLHHGDRAAASEQFAASLRENRALRDWGGVVRCLSAFAALAGAGGDTLRAARLTGAFESQFRATGTVETLNDRREYEFHMSAILAGLPDAAYDAGRAEGAAMSMEQAIEYALADSHA